MEEKFNESTINRPEGDRLLDAPFVIADLTAHIKQITEEDAWFKNDRNAITVFKSNHISVVLVALRETAEVKPPSPSAGVVTLQVISGSLTIEIEGQTFTAGKQQLVSFHEQLQYNITATEESVFLMTVYNYNH